jgi:Spy/CpxP family protein refolding chaperone
VSKVLMRRVLTGVLVGFVAATVAAADAQGKDQRPPQKEPVRDAPRGGPPGPSVGMRFKWWQDPKVIAELRLAPAQSARIAEIWQGWFNQMKPTPDDLVRREEQISNLIFGNDVTEAEVLKQADQAEALRASLNKSRTLMLYRVRRVLSAEQRSKLADMQKAQDRERRQGRPPDRGPGER